ncbi:hypothetical protein [Sphaerisporangium flaviroseum]|uniref:hypothetical protein n=1 Tax=Sphaerisporangium flaviroseum TaxID=509199 RepID=UPI0031E66A44
MTSPTPDKPNERSSIGSGRSRGRVPRPLIVATTVALLTSGGIGLAAAAAATPTPPPTGTPTPTPTISETPTDIPTPTPTDTSTEPPAEPPAPAPTVVPPLGAWAFTGALHGDLVVPAKPRCTFVTLFVQTGEATAVAEDSVTVRSQDGYERTYTIAESTRTIAGRWGNSEVRQGDWVSVSALTEGETATAAYIIDLSRPSRNIWRGHGYWYSKQWPVGTAKWRTPKPCPTPTPTITPTPSVTPTVTPTDTVTPTVTPTEPTTEPTPTVTQTVTADPTPTP